MLPRQYDPNGGVFMLSQTIDQIMPLLLSLQQPAFCIRQDGGVACNGAARHLAPENRDGLTAWLDAAASLYEDWNRKDGLELPVNRAGRSYSVTIQALLDGELFLLSESGGSSAGASLAVAAQVLRQPLTELFSLSQQLFGDLEEAEDPALQSQTAAMSRHLYRLVRITGNLADLEQLRSGQYRLRWSRLELGGYLAPMAEALTAVCADAERTLECKTPREQVQFFADQDLLERAILNLLSNAIKYGTAAQPIRLWAEVRPTAILFRVRNHCAAADGDLLSAAFQRMEQRGVLPDPRWGVGLGLPLARHIAQLHGGAVALEAAADGTVTVTMSISRKRPSQEALLKSPPPQDYAGGMQRSLVELSDVLPDRCYDSTMI